MINAELFEDVVKIRRDLHQYPETGFDLSRTANIVAKELKQLGLDVKEHVGRIGVVADLKVPGADGIIAFRADMDALPMDEETDFEFRSAIPGKAHMCGHDGHTAILIGAAKLIVSEKQSLRHSIRFIFQPNEEQFPGGATAMMDEGCLEGVKAIYGLHVWPWLNTGEIGICAGPMLAQADGFHIVIHGQGGHAAAPHNNIDPIVIGAQLVGMIQTIVSRTISPLDPAVVTVARFSGGSAFNVTPDTANLYGTVRTYHPSVQKIIKEALSRMVQQTSLAFGASATMEYFEGYPPLINHESSCHVVKEAAKVFLDDHSIRYPAEKAMFGEDFAYYVQKVPGCFIQLGCRNESKGCIHPLHSPKFNLDEECFKVGVRLFKELAFT